MRASTVLSLLLNGVLVVTTLHFLTQPAPRAEAATQDTSDSTSDIACQPRVVERVVHAPPVESAITLDQLDVQYTTASTSSARKRVIRDLAPKVGAEAIGWLAERLEGADGHVAAVALGEIGGLGAAGLLEDALLSRHRTRSSVGAAGLGALGAPLGEQILLRALRADSAYPPRHAVYSALGHVASSNAVDALVAAVHDTRHGHSAVAALRQSVAGQTALLGLLTPMTPVDVQIRALGGLADLEGEDVYAAIDSALGAEDARLRAAALRTLSHRPGDAALTRLENAVRGGAIEERRAALEALGQRDDEPSLQMLCAWLSKLPAELQSTVVYSLANHPAPRAVTFLQEQLTNGRPQLRATIANALAHSHPQFLTTLDPRTLPREMHYAVLRALALSKDPEDSERLVGFAAGGPGELPDLALRMLEPHMSDAAFQTLDKALLSEHPSRVQAALQQFGGLDRLDATQRAKLLQRISTGEIGDGVFYALGSAQPKPDFVNALQSALDVAPRSHRYGIINALAKLPNGAGVAPLEAALAGTTEQGDRNTIITAIANHVSDAGTAIITRLAKAGDKAALNGLRSLPSEVAIPILTHAIQSNDAQTAYSAAMALTNQPGEASLAALKRFALNNDQYGPSVIGSLSNRTDARPFLLDQAAHGEPAARGAAIHAVGRHLSAQQMETTLGSALTDDNSQVRSAARSVLQYHPAARAGDMLGQAFDRTTDNQVRAQLALALKARGGRAYRSRTEAIDELTASPYGWEPPEILLQ